MTNEFGCKHLDPALQTKALELFTEYRGWLTKKLKTSRKKMTIERIIEHIDRLSGAVEAGEPFAIMRTFGYHLIADTYSLHRSKHQARFYRELRDLKMEIREDLMEFKQELEPGDIVNGESGGGVVRLGNQVATELRRDTRSFQNEWLGTPVWDVSEALYGNPSLKVTTNARWAYRVAA